MMNSSVKSNRKQHALNNIVINCKNSKNNDEDINEKNTNENNEKDKNIENESDENKIKTIPILKHITQTNTKNIESVDQQYNENKHENDSDIINIQIFCSHTADNLNTIYDELVEHYNNTEIDIIDVDYILKGTTPITNIFNLINTCDIFIADLTPYQKYFCDNNGDKIVYENDYILNPNILLELGYAISCKKQENIFITIKNDCKIIFDKLIPSMIKSFHISYFDNIDDVIDIIDNNDMCKKGFRENIFCDYFYNKIIDSNIISMLKYDTIKKLNENINDHNKIFDIINDLVPRYIYYDDIVEIIILFLEQKLHTKEKNFTKYVDFFSSIMYNCICESIWITKDESIKIIKKIISHIDYKLFLKYNNSQDEKYIRSRINYTIMLYDLDKKINIDIKSIMTKNIGNLGCNDYKNYISEYKKFISNKHDKNKIEDIILNLPKYNCVFINID